MRWRVNFMYDRIPYPGPFIFYPYASNAPYLSQRFSFLPVPPVYTRTWHRAQSPFVSEYVPAYYDDPSYWDVFPEWPPPVVHRPHPGYKLIDSFKTKDGQIDVNKMITTAGQLIGTVNQLAGTVKNISSLFKS